MKKHKNKIPASQIPNYLTKHHIVNRVNGGTSDPRNLIMLRRLKHEAWHQIFKDLSFLEASNLLLRAHNLINRKSAR